MKLFVSLFSTLHGLSELELVIPGHNYQMSEIMSKYNFDVVKISNISDMISNFELKTSNIAIFVILAILLAILSLKLAILAILAIMLQY